MEARLVEVARVDVIKNLEKKVYRATATNFVSRQFFDLKPNDERLGRAFKTYFEIQGQLMTKMSAFSDIPKGVDPVDFSVYAYVKSSCQLFLDPSLKEKLRRLEREISEFEKAQRVSDDLETALELCQLSARYDSARVTGQEGT